MPRKVVQPSSNHLYHIGARCHNREWFDIPKEDVWAIFEDYLHFIHYGFNIQIFSFVLMSNHFHLLIQSPEANLSKAMNYFMRETSRQIGYSANRINQTYGSRYSRSLIDCHHYYLCAYKYIYRNPIEAKICERVEDYTYSSLAVLLGLRKSLLPIVEDETLFADIEGTLSWLNTPGEKTAYESVRKALKKKIFAFGQVKNTGKNNPLISNLY